MKKTTGILGLSVLTTKFEVGEPTSVTNLTYAGVSSAVMVRAISSRGLPTNIRAFQRTVVNASMALVTENGESVAFEGGRFAVLMTPSHTDYNNNNFKWLTVDDSLAAEAQGYAVKKIVVPVQNAGPTAINSRLQDSLDFVGTIDDTVDIGTQHVDFIADTEGAQYGVVLSNGMVVRPVAQTTLSIAKNPSNGNITAGQSATITITPLVADANKDRIIYFAKTLASARYSINRTSVVIPKDSLAAVTVTVTTTAGAALASTSVSYRMDAGGVQETGTVAFAIV
jgi:hypothetical protein